MVEEEPGGERMPRWALILGCSVGTGAGVARSLARKNGLDIVGFHRGNHAAEAAAVQHDVEQAGRRCILIEHDAGRLEGIPAQVSRIAECLGRSDGLQIVVHALTGASLGPVACRKDPARALHPRQVARTFDAMAHSFLFWGQALVHEGLFARGGQLLGLLNFQDESTPPGFAAIGGVKGALTAYVRHMAFEFPRYGVRVNALRFGATETEAFGHVPNAHAALDNIARVSPMGRNVQIDDVGSFVSLLADERAQFLNGSIIPFDGGETAAYAVQMLQPARPETAGERIR